MVLPCRLQLRTCPCGTPRPQSGTIQGENCRMSGANIVIIAVVVIVVLVLFLGIKTVPQGYNYTVERFRRYTGTLSPGLNLIVPFFDTIGAKLNVMEQVLDVPR